MSDFMAALHAHAWPVVVGFILLAFVWIGRHPAAQPQWCRVPAQWRPVVPIAIGLLSSVGDALTSGREWLPALLLGLGSAIPAVLYALPSPVVPGQTVVVSDSERVTITRREP